MVEEIEHLRDLITAPPKALSVLDRRDVCVVAPQQPVGAALGYVERFDYSQIPVYDSGPYIGILTTNAIARWLAHQLGLNQGLAEGEPVDRVLAFSEPHDHAKLVSRTITAAEAIDQLTHGGEGRTPITALIVSHNGKPTEKPIRVITSSDLPMLSAGLGIVAP